MIIQGSALTPNTNTIIAHVCNDVGAFGAGFAFQVAKAYPIAQKLYFDWANSKFKFELGEVQIIQIEKDLFIANMIAQHGLRNKFNPIPFRYDAFESCLEKVNKFTKTKNLKVQMPHGIGSGLATGDPDKIKIICEKIFGDKIIFYKI